MTKEQKRRPPVFTPAEENNDDIFAESGIVETPEPEPVSERVFSEPEPAPEVVLPEPELVPAEEVLPNGWKVISLEQQTGKRYLVTADLETNGVRAFWRKTRVLSHFKWKMHGKWTNALTHGDVLPEPRYYKELG